MDPGNVSIYVCVFVCACVCVCMYLYMYVCMHVDMYGHTYVCANVIYKGIQTSGLTLWHRNFLLNLSTPCI